MEPYIPLSRIPGPIIVATVSGKPLAPIRYHSLTEDQEAVVVARFVGPKPKPEVTTLRAMVGAQETPTIRDVFLAA